MPATLLLILPSGIPDKVFSLARPVTWLPEHRSIPLRSFFFGLILVSSRPVGRRQPASNLAE
ncbi:undecaprenyl phosphate translocase family protein [Azorhizophilus paspali]|uniref:Undecaprenyl phosphate translocase family protein n=1 Tax=Azorhizophilus paspali TaxID=69963 RepID=A0ABV6SI96_AZOPA